MKLIEQLGSKCSKCGFNDCRAIDINHIDRTKKLIPMNRHFTWSNRLKDWEKDPSNLELLCANCHRIHTWGQMGYGIVTTDDLM